MLTQALTRYKELIKELEAQAARKDAIHHEELQEGPETFGQARQNVRLRRELEGLLLGHLLTLRDLAETYRALPHGEASKEAWGALYWHISGLEEQEGFGDAMGWAWQCTRGFVPDDWCDEEAAAIWGWLESLECKPGDEVDF